jgi:hypothetical protein
MQSGKSPDSKVVHRIPHTVVIDTDGIIRYSDNPAYLTAEAVKPWLSQTGGER